MSPNSQRRSSQSGRGRVASSSSEMSQNSRRGAASTPSSSQGHDRRDSSSGGAGASSSSSQRRSRSSSRSGSGSGGGQAPPRKSREAREADHMNEAAAALAEYLLSEEAQATEEEVREDKLDLAVFLFQVLDAKVDFAVLSQIALRILNKYSNCVLAINQDDFYASTKKAASEAAVEAVQAALESNAIAGSAPAVPRAVASAITAVAALALPHYHLFPEELKNNLDAEKHLAYKAAWVLFHDEHSDYEEAFFKARFAKALTDVKSERAKKCRTVVFTSFRTAADAVVWRYWAENPEEDSPTQSPPADAQPANEEEANRQKPCLMSLSDLNEVLLSEWKNEEMGRQNEKAGEFAGRALAEILKPHSDGNTVRTAVDVLGLESVAQVDSLVTAKLMKAVVHWSMKTLEEDRTMYNEAHPGDSQLTEGGSDPTDEDDYEAPNFGAANRLFQWIDRYETPAVGGGKDGRQSGASSRKKRRTARQYLDTADDQTFNKKLFELLGKRTVRTSRNWTSDNIATVEDAQRFFKPYLRPDSS